ncbi:MAG: GNAT family N-acetyltransferase [Proteobacteria bacterium]|nr:GNAT family N-acetyltransferase [Pseudomonadota bacterium]
MTHDDTAAAVIIGAKPPQSPAVPVRSIGEVPLSFWIGPKKIASIKLRVQNERWPIDPFDDRLPPPPALTMLPGDVAGVYRPSEPQAELGPALTRSDSMLRYVVSSYRRRFIDMAAGFDIYMAKFSGKTRSTLRRKIRNFEKTSDGRIDWRIYRRPAEMDEFHAFARAVSELTYQEKLFDAGIPADTAFLESMRSLAEADAVRGYILFLKGKPISYLYCPIEDGRVIYGFLGFDPAHAGLSAGTVLQMLALEQLFSEKRYRLFDFTEGEGAHKTLFSTELRLCANVFYLRPSLKNTSYVRLHLASQRMFNLADSVVAQSGLKAWLRRKIRGQVDQH